MKLLYQAWNANNLYDWGLAALIVLGVLLGLVALNRGAGWALRAFKIADAAHPDGIAEKVLAGTRLWLLFPVALYAAASAIDLPAKLEQLIDVIVIVALLVQTALWINCLVTGYLAKLIEQRRGVDSEAVTVLALLGFAARIMVWAFTLLLILNHLNFNITALVTGLGIGGVAVALAVQNILGDLFASLSIILDKPFVMGDFVVVGDCMGTVEHIGLKTTRVRSLGGELIVFSNTDLLKSRIRNYRHLHERRVVFTVGVAYDTSADKLRKIPAMLHEAVKANKQTRVDRAHFKEYGESSLVFEVVYYVASSDFNVYMDIQQAINLWIFEKFAREGIDFAYPAQTLHAKSITQSPARQRLNLIRDAPWAIDSIG
jgi:small-conductance mechanosensitive channel